MTYTLSLDLMHEAASFGKRHSDLIAGAPNYGLRPERRIDKQLLHRLGNPVPTDEELWIPPPDGYDSWTAVVGKALRSERNLPINHKNRDAVH